MEAAAARFQAAIDGSVCAALRNNGYAVVDGLFGSSMADALREELVSLFKAGAMHKNATHLVKERTHLLEKASIYEAELSALRAEQAPLCTELAQTSYLPTMLNVHMGLRLESQAIKLQYNAGSTTEQRGGCFPCHVDTDATVDTRLVTAIYYLNPRWRTSHAGMLKLYPWPQPPVEVAPLHDRLVLFPSQRMIHRVTPFRGPHTQDSSEPGTDPGRCCFTIWLSESARARRGPRPARLSTIAPSDATDHQSVARFLMSPAVRLHAAKLALADEWRASLEEAHPPGAALSAVLESYDAELEVTRKALGRYEATLQKLRADPVFADDVARRHLAWF